MPFIDVSALLLDPDFTTTFDVIRSTQTMSSGGVASDAPVTTSAIRGVVTPNKSASFLRFDGGEYLAGSITVYTQFALTAGAGQTDADTVVWPSGTGRLYWVKTVDDWSQFGAGFISAICVLKTLNP